MSAEQGLLATNLHTPSVAEIAKEFLVLGSTAFGGPPVHLGMFQKRFADRWLPSKRYTELIAMANCLPGPTSTQVAFAIGITQQGVVGGLAAGISFLFPGMIVMTVLGFVSHVLKQEIQQPKSAANGVAICCSAVGVALVFIAVTQLLKKNVEVQIPEREGKKTNATLGAICFGVAAVVLAVDPKPAWLNPALIIAGGAITAAFPVPKQDAVIVEHTDHVGLPVAGGVAIFVLYIVLGAWTIYDSAVDKGWLIPFLTAGMFVWGGGPVVLPMLMTVLTPHWIPHEIFLTGIALAEMMPGPVFNMSCFLGVQLSLANGVFWPLGTLLCWLGLIWPGVILTFGAMPLWGWLRSFAVYNRALPGLNAAAVGLLVSAAFTVYTALQDRSPWPGGSLAVSLCAYAAIEMVGLNVPVTVLVAGLAGFAWSECLTLADS